MPIDQASSNSAQGARFEGIKNQARAFGGGLAEAFKDADKIAAKAGVEPSKGAGTYKGDLRNAANFRSGNGVVLENVKERAYVENRDHAIASAKSFGRDLAGYGLAAAAATPAGVIFQPVFKSIARAAFNGLTAATNPQADGNNGVGNRLKSAIAAIVSSFKNDAVRVTHFGARVLSEARHGEFSTLKDQLLSHKHAPETWGNAISILGGLAGLAAGGPLGAIAGFALGKAVGRGIGTMVAKAAAPKVEIEAQDGSESLVRGGLSWKATAMQALTGGFAGKLSKLDPSEAEMLKSELGKKMQGLAKKQLQLTTRQNEQAAKGAVTVEDLKGNQKLSREIRDLATEANGLVGLLQSSGFGAETVKDLSGQEVTLDALAGSDDSNSDNDLAGIANKNSQAIKDAYQAIKDVPDQRVVQSPAPTPTPTPTSKQGQSDGIEVELTLKQGDGVKQEPDQQAANQADGKQKDAV